MGREAAKGGAHPLWALRRWICSKSFSGPFQLILIGRFEGVIEEETLKLDGKQGVVGRSRMAEVPPGKEACGAFNLLLAHWR